MLAPIAISFDHVSKRYWLGRTRTLGGIVGSALERLRRNGRLGPEAVLAARARRDTLWAVRDVSFELGVGESLGIIGRNGAGKTTILKLINRVTAPTIGDVRTRGRIISLLELGASFHGELTGRENIYLSGAIFGLRRREVEARFDQIVQFAEIERIVDTPVKRFSAGLFARLGFSAAVHSSPDIVLVDEVLAVGDEAFQRKALDKLSALVEEGVTLALVSHDMRTVERVCRRAMWVDQGKVMAVGEPAEIMRRYGREIEAAIRRTPDETPWASAPGPTVFSKLEGK